MTGFRCRLCGGKLVHNRCTLCGLDNTCYDLDYSLQKKYSGQQAQPAAEQQPAPVQNSTAQKPAAAGPSANRPAYKKTGAPAPGNRNKTARITVIIVAIFILISIFISAAPALTDMIGSLTSGSTYEDLYSVDDDWSVEEHDPYAFVTRDIPEDGAAYETVLGTGVYQTGIHIPEGIYRAELLEGTGSIHISDNENSIYDYTYFGTDEEYDEVTAMDDIRLYNGAQLTVDSGVLIRLSTDNAQPLTGEPYPAASSGLFFLPEGNYTAGGEEIPEGIYDISIDTDENDPYGYASITLIYPNGSSDYFWADSPESAVSADGCSSAGVKNVVIPDGTEISVEYGDIILTPGQACYDVDYADYPQL